MPKSKRNKQVDLSKTKKHGQEGKKKLYEEVRSCVENYANVFIFSVNDMRNSKIKSVREQWRHSRFFIGKNKVMALSLGISPESEFRKNLHKIGERLKGERGLLFSNQSAEEVLKWFSSYSEGDFARSGNRAIETVILKEGPLSQFPHNLEPHLRSLGLPTALKKGVIHLIQDHTVCNAGDVLTPETARIVKLLGYEMAEFYIKIECVWSQDGSFLDLRSGEKSKKNVDNINTSAFKDLIDDQEMEVEDSTSIEDNNQTKLESKNFENGWLVEDENKNVYNKSNSNQMNPDYEDSNVKDDEKISENYDPEMKDRDEKSEISEDEVIPELVEDNESKATFKDKAEILSEKIEEFSLEKYNVIPEDPKNFVNVVKDSEIENKKNSEDETISDSVEDNKSRSIKEITEVHEEKEVFENNEIVSENVKGLSENYEEGINKTSKSDHSESNKEKKSKKSSSSVIKISDVIDIPSTLNSNALQSPVLEEKRPKFSPRVTRSIKKAKKPVQKITENNVDLETKAKEKTIEENTEQKNRAHKRHSTGESPVVRKLRNRSVKVVQNKK